MSAALRPAPLLPYPVAPASVQHRARGVVWRIRLELLPYLVTEPVADPMLRAALQRIDEELSEIARAVDGAPPAPCPAAVYDPEAANAAPPEASVP